ncbi:MAG: hypothetical protein HY365_01470 [Candidatus Aenigmarchaeota archaeon]|nr:hypothetical protein [Candidatus Aenigmarchaeota archaeon]
MTVKDNTLVYLQARNAIPFYEFALESGEPEIVAMQLGLVAAHKLDGVPYEQMQRVINCRPDTPRSNLRQALTELMEGGSYAIMMNVEFGMILSGYSSVRA